MRVIVALSGGKASAYCAKWAFDNYPKDQIILYFNDTKWEHPDLYRFINDLATYFDHPITYDNDGRSPEDLFYHHRALASNRMPFCSRVLKAQRLQGFFQDGDHIVFGIGTTEPQRATRIVQIYQKVAATKDKWPKLFFPLIQHQVSNDMIDQWLKETKIEAPLLYRLGFSHNNCSGGCVRAGKNQWRLLYERLPEVYMERERVENDIRAFLNKDVSIMRDETLEQFRGRIERGELNMRYYADLPPIECIGICQSME